MVANATRSVLLVILLAGLVAGVTRVTYAAFSSATSSTGNTYAAGTVTLTDNDGGSAMLSLSSAPLGASDTSCMRASYSGSLDSTVRHYATVAGSLAPYLSLKVTRGGGSAGFDNCTGFTPDSTDYIGAGAGVIYNGKLSSYPTSYANGLVDPAASGAGTYSATVLGTSGLLSYWRLGDNATVVSDTFTDTAGVLLQSHTGEVGATWTRYSISTSGTDGVISNENRIRRNAGGVAMYYASGAPTSADYSVQADVHVKSILSSDAIGVIGRASTSADTYYLARYTTSGATDQWELSKTVSGTITSLGTYAQTLTAGSSYTLTLDLQGSTIRLLVDGVQRISATDSSITAAGQGGTRIGFSGATSIPSNTTGLHLDNLTVSGSTPPADDSNASNDGTYSSGVTLAAAGALTGDTNTAAQFDGTSGRVEVPNQASLQLTGSFSIEAWIKPDSLTGTRYLLHKDTFYYLYLVGSDLVFGFRSGGSYKYVTASGAASVGSWQHILGIYDGSMLRLYRNGLQVASAPQSGAVDTGTGSLFIGAFSAGGSFFSGTLDEAALYSGALAADDVGAHYAVGRRAETWTNPESHDYKFEITLDNDLAVEGLSSTATFTWEARNT